MQSFFHIEAYCVYLPSFLKGSKIRWEAMGWKLLVQDGAQSSCENVTEQILNCVCGYSDNLGGYLISRFDRP